MINDKSGFMFMIEMLDDIFLLYDRPMDIFDKDDEATITGEIYEFECIYDNFQHASKYKAPSSDVDEPYGRTRF